MKFLCDRCKTRYSIGDDRVRGKILKIRCKNCANVITVREGMSAEDDERRSRPTTAAPMSTVGQPATDNGALASAFAQQLAKPPPALEEEWYVSIDGVQSGPFGLAAAQRWISAKAFDADLHCWSEGFDDWLPVDKVSHFRGLRKKARPTTVPPPTPPPRTLEDEPKPLFAATMASLERASTNPSATAIPAAHAVATNGATAKANGTGPGPSIVPRGPVAAKTMVGMGAKANGAVASAGQSALAAAFDVPTESEPAVAVEPMPFADLAPQAAAAGFTPAHDDAEDNLEIGEVSRVVNLADLMKSGNQPRAKTRAPGLRGTGATPKLDPAMLGLAGATAPGALAIAPEAEGLTAAPVVAQAHRRGLVMLIGVAGVLLAGVTVLLVLMLNRNDGDVAEGGLGPAHEIDTSRPEEIVRAHMLPPVADGSAGSAARTIRHFQPPPPHGGTPTVDTPEVPSNHLKADEIEDMAQKQSAGTQRCYMRAQRGAEGVMLGDLKKIAVTLVVDKTGAVSDVQLSDHATDSLGMCLSGQIKRWKFRESSGGQFRIVLAFADN